MKKIIINFFLLSVLIFSITTFNNLSIDKVYAEDSIEWTKDTNMIADDLHSIIFSNNKYVAVGQGVVSISSDGLKWENIDIHIRSNLVKVIWTGEKYIAVGTGGTIIYSTDGLNWIQSDTGIDCTINDICVDNGRLVAVGQNTILSSLDGISWTKANIPNPAILQNEYKNISNKNFNIFSVTYENGNFIAYARIYKDRIIFISEDGVNWTEHSSVISTMQNVKKIFGYKGRYFLFGKEDSEPLILNSTDGENWSKNANFNGDFSNVSIEDAVIVENKIVAYGLRLTPGKSELIMIESVDGVNWDLKKCISISTNDIYDFCESKDSYVFVGMKRTILKINEKYDIEKNIQSGYLNYNDIIIFKEKYYLAGDYGVFKVSSDCNEWNDVKLTKPYDVKALASNNSSIIAVGSNGNISISKDGLLWDTMTIEKFTEFDDAVWNGEKYIAIGKYNPVNTSEFSGVIYTSADGVKWEKMDIGKCQSLNSITWNGKIFVATGAGGVILTSSDGVSWNKQESNIKYLTIYGITWGGSQFVGVAGQDLGYCTIIKSEDGVNWDTNVLKDKRRIYDAITYNGKEFIAVGYNGALIRSTDGQNWSDIWLDKNVKLNNILWDGNKYIVVGINGAMVYGNIINPDFNISYDKQVINSSDHFTVDSIPYTVNFDDNSKGARSWDWYMWDDNTNGWNWFAEGKNITKNISANGAAIKLVINKNSNYYIIKSFSVEPKPITVELNNKQIKFDNNPVEENGTILVQLRPIVEQLGLTVTWDVDTNTITLNNKTTKVLLKIGSNIAEVNDKEVTLACPVKIIGENTFIPVRFLSESLGAMVSWDELNRKVTISK